MNAPFELQIALRYLLAKRKQAFISVISLISTLGVTVGVMALVIALALMTGLQGELRDRILGANPHIFVWKRAAAAGAAAAGTPGAPAADTGGNFAAQTAMLRALPHVIGAAPAIIGKALVSAAGDQAFINLKGIDPAVEPQVTALVGAMRTGSLDALSNQAADAPGAILLGTDLAAQLGVKVGDSISVLTPQGTLSPMGMIPRARRLRVAGTFTLGLYEIDSQTGFVSLDVARRLLDRQDIDAIQLRLDDVFLAPQVAAGIGAKLGSGWFAQDWADMNSSLFSALWLEKMAISLTIGLIVMVAALNIVASLILLVMEKHRDIAILKTMGASARSITTIFMLQGLIIGVVGTAAGATLGFTVARILDKYKLIRVPVDVYQISHVPFTVLPLDFMLVVLAAILVSFVATIYPSRQAAKLDPAQALRYE
jgi:lipoprotein-releasing system permease protein